MKSEENKDTNTPTVTPQNEEEETLAFAKSSASEETRNMASDKEASTDYTATNDLENAEKSAGELPVIIDADPVKAEKASDLNKEAVIEDLAPLAINPKDSTPGVENYPSRDGSIKQGIVRALIGKTARVVTADTVQAEEVPTIPLDSLHTLSQLQPAIAVHTIDATGSISMPTPLVVQPSEYRRSLGEWFKIWREGIRLFYLPLALLPVILGNVLAWIPTIHPRTPLGHFHLLHFIGALLFVGFLQIGANLVNDYYDYLRGIDASNTLGPGVLIRQGYVKPTRVLTVGLLFLVLGAGLGLFLAVTGGSLLLFLFGLIAVLASYFYSATTYALSSRLLGELCGFIIYGPLITLGAYLLQSGGQLTATAFIYGCIVGLLAVAVIVANNMRDIEADTNAHKHTLMTIIKLPFSRVLFILLLLGAYILVTLSGFPHQAPHWTLLALWTFPSLVVIVTGVIRTNAPAGFDLVMQQTIKLEAWFVTLLTIGLIISALTPVLPQLPAHLLPF